MKRYQFVIGFLLLAGLLVSACGGGAPGARENWFIWGPTPVFQVVDPLPQPTLYVIATAIATASVSEDPQTMQAPMLDSGMDDVTDGNKWSGAILVGDDKYDHRMEGWVKFDLRVIPVSNSGLTNATLNLGSCSPAGAPSALEPFHVIVLTGGGPLGSITGACTASYDVTGMIQGLIGRFTTFEVLIKPSQISANGIEDSYLYNSPALWITYYP